MSLSALQQALQQIDQCLQAIAPALAGHLRSGLTTAEITVKVAVLPLQLPAEVYALYQWHDGSDPECPVQLLPTLYNPAWFPLFAEDCNYYLVQGVDRGADPPPMRAPILDFFSEDPETPVVFDALTAMMQAIAACWQSGAYGVEPLGAGQFQTVGNDGGDRLGLTYQPQRAAQIAALARGDSTQLTPEQQRQGYMDLVATQPEVALPTLRAALATRSQSDPERCYDLIYALGRLQTPAATASLFSYLNHAHQGIRAAVVMTLVWTVPAPILQAVPDLAAIVPSLLSLFSREPEWLTQRRDIAMLLGRIGDPRAVAPLVAALTLPAPLPAGELSVSLAILFDRDVRLAIVTSLGQLGDLQAADPLFEVAQTDADPTVRLWAAKTLRQLGDDAASETLRVRDALRATIAAPRPRSQPPAAESLPPKRRAGRGPLEKCPKRGD